VNWKQPCDLKWTTGLSLNERKKKTIKKKKKEQEKKTSQTKKMGYLFVFLDSDGMVEENQLAEERVMGTQEAPEFQPPSQDYKHASLVSSSSSSSSSSSCISINLSQYLLLLPWTSSLIFFSTINSQSFIKL